MIEALEEKDTYLSQFARLEERLEGKRRPWVHRIRKAGMVHFAELGFPTTRHEEWRFTNVAPLTKIPFRPVGDDELDGVAAESLKQFTFGGFDGTRLVFVNGRFSRELSSIRPLHNGMKVMSLAAALESDRERVEPYLARHAGYQDHAFVALNTAFVEDGAFVYVPPDTLVEHPVHLLFASTSLDRPTVSHPRNLIVLGANSQITIVESYIGLDGGVYFTNAVTEVIAAQNAVVDHCGLVQESAEAFHIATLAVHQDRGSIFTSHSVSLSGALIRNNLNARLDAEGAECTLNGLYLAGGRQLVDNHTSIDHAKPHCSSHEVYKGVLDGKSKGVFSGKIIVRPDAQKTDARQTNKNLLLSADAVIDTKPQLQIYADDVKCTHGATVGQLDKEAIFYLRSRGIGQEDARNMLTYAFAKDILSRIKVDEVRTQLDEALLNWLPKSHAMKEALC